MILRWGVRASGSVSFSSSIGELVSLSVSVRLTSSVQPGVMTCDDQQWVRLFVSFEGIRTM